MMVDFKFSYLLILLWTIWSKSTYSLSRPDYTFIFSSKIVFSSMTYVKDIVLNLIQVYCVINKVTIVAHRHYKEFGSQTSSCVIDPIT
jgi:hypothetical protein